MRERAAVLCGAAAVVAGALTAVPAEASTPPTADTAHAAPLTWKKCGTKKYPTLQCASLKVPLDHSRPRGRQITLALSRVPHTAKKFQGPLLVNPGGPGGSGLNLAGFVASTLPRAVAAQYDVIGFDPRGVGKSKPALDCRPGHFAAVRGDAVPSTFQIEQANLRRAETFARACGEKYGDVLPYIDTVSTVRDMDRIRAALGARQINYFGYSYGTYLGAVYAKLFPERVRRAALDSVVDPTGVWYASNLAQDHAFNARHRAFMAWVAKHNSTYRLGTHPELVGAKWYAMRAALARTAAGGKVGASELDDTYVPGGYYNGHWPHLAEAFAAYVNDKNADLLIEAYDKLGAADASDDNGYSIYASVQCRDAAWPRDWHVWRADNWVVYAKAPFMTWSNAWYNAPCAFWPTSSLHSMNVANAKVPPVLLFQATEDAATPYAGAVTAHRLLARSSLVVEQGGGNHGITLGGNACLDKYLTAYLTDGTVPRRRGAVDAVCEALPDPKPLSSKVASTSSRGAELHELVGFRR
ncbi:alpha/beta hydrolase [Streptomyces regalis]|uniref:Peptidase n=1 Tax=Streptomyces regalis TaxID=68262 RepID=A0A101JE60_9ACTN|nr:alpha/beta fold hydrolase [Streptomyces regalis]KUL25103.1 peptidase [Streptomyces regalis]